MVLLGTRLCIWGRRVQGDLSAREGWKQSYGVIFLRAARCFSVYVFVVLGEAMPSCRALYGAFCVLSTSRPHAPPAVLPLA